MDYGSILSDLRILILCVIFLFVTEVYLIMEEQLKEAISKTIVITNNKIQIEAERFNFADKVTQLRKYGVLDKYPKLEQPHYYLVIHLAIGIILMLLISLFYPLYSIFGLAAGFLLPSMYFKHANDKDNEAMRDDVLMVYNILSTQSKGGVYIGTALGECKTLITNKRLKKAIEEFDKHVKIQDITLKENLDILESKFESSDISSLCLIIRQNEESGRSNDILRDIKKQIHDTEEMILQKKKAEMERSMTIVMLILFMTSMAYILYQFVSQIITNSL